MKFFKFEKIIMLAALLAATGARAEDMFTINGFGFQDYRQSTANVQDGADKRGTWENGMIAFVMSGKIGNHDTAWAQLESTATEPTAFVWAFLDHRFSDNLTMHVGRVKLPMGLYNEFVDNKWLQLGVTQPFIYKSASDLVVDAYSGVGFDWTADSLFVQVFGGNTYANPSLTPPDTFPPGVSPHEHRRLLGTRITWNTPLEGLRLMASSDTGYIESVAPSSVVGALKQELRTIFSLDYVSDNIDFKSEYATHKFPAFPGVDTSSTAIPQPSFPGLTSKAWYFQGGYRIGLWMPYVRFDHYVGDTNNKSDPSHYQKDWVIGVNYTINENMNARVEDHLNHGYGMADGGTALDWNTAAAEINFIF